MKFPEIFIIALLAVTLFTGCKNSPVDPGDTLSRAKVANATSTFAFTLTPFRKDI